jgi:hypothetical protein
VTVDHQTFAGYFSVTLSPNNNPTTSTLNFGRAMTTARTA